MTVKIKSFEKFDYWPMISYLKPKKTSSVWKVSTFQILEKDHGVQPTSKVWGNKNKTH